MLHLRLNAKSSTKEECFSSPTHLQGNSFLPTLKNPKKKHRDYAFVQWGKGVNLITPQYSYAQWYDDSRNVVGEMLFDYRSDPHENKNVAREKNYERLIEQFKSHLQTSMSNL